MFAISTWRRQSRYIIQNSKPINNTYWHRIREAYTYYDSCLSIYLQYWNLSKLIKNLIFWIFIWHFLIFYFLWKSRGHNLVKIAIVPLKKILNQSHFLKVRLLFLLNYVLLGKAQRRLKKFYRLNKNSKKWMLSEKTTFSNKNDFWRFSQLFLRPFN